MNTIIFPATYTYNYVSRKYQPCLVILVASLEINGKVYPIDFDFWVDKFMYEEGVVYLSKNEVTERMLEYFCNQSLNIDKLLMDAGFCSPKLLNFISDKGLTLITKFPKSRKIKVNETKKRADEVFEETENRDYYFYNGHGFVIHEKVSYHNIEYQLVALANTKERLESKQLYYLLCNDLSIKFPQIVKLYKKRWKIECLFKILKSYLGLCSFNSNNEDAIVAHINFCFSAFIVLQGFAEKHRMTIHESLMEIQSQSLDWVRHIVTSIFEKEVKFIVKPAF